MNRKRFLNMVSEYGTTSTRLFDQYKKFEAKAEEAYYNYLSAVADLEQNEDVIRINKIALKNTKDECLRDTIKEQLEFGKRYRVEHTLLIKHYKERARLYREVANSYRMAFQWCKDFLCTEYKNTIKELNVGVIMYSGGGIRVLIKDSEGNCIKKRYF